MPEWVKFEIFSLPTPFRLFLDLADLLHILKLLFDFLRMERLHFLLGFILLVLMVLAAADFIQLARTQQSLVKAAQECLKTFSFIPFEF